MQHSTTTDAYVYVLHSDPHTPTPNIEDDHLLTVGITITWSTNVLFHTQLHPNESFSLGEGALQASTRALAHGSARRSAQGAWGKLIRKALGDRARDGFMSARQFVLPPEVLGTSRVALVCPTRDGSSVVLSQLPLGARIGLPDGTNLDRSELSSACHARGGVTDQGEVYWPLSDGSLSIQLGDFVVECSLQRAAKPVPRALLTQTSGESLTYFGLSFASAAALLASVAFFTPPLGLTGSERIERDDLILMQQYLDAAAERERETLPSTEDSGQDTPSGESGRRADGAEGALGDPQTATRNRRFAVKGPPDNPEPHLAKPSALEQATTFGMIGILSAAAASEAPSAPWGRETPLGADSLDAMGSMWGDSIGDARGDGGLGVSGPGIGGGGLGEGIGLGAVGTIHGGMGADGESGFGRHHGRLVGTHQNKGFRMRTATPTVSGRLPPQVIQRIVRQNHGRFRLCYERALAANPNLAGRVTVRFVIGRNGAVSNASNGGSTLASAEVTRCVVSAFYGLSFPKPEGGLVTVSYPIAFSPD